MNKLIQVSTKLTADQFGCNQEHFNEHLRGHVLPVISETRNFVTVLDATGEEWTVNKADLSPKQDPAIESGAVVQTQNIASQQL